MRRRTSDEGFTLVELVGVMSIAGVLGLIGIFGFTNYRNAAQLRGTAQEVVSQLRNASERAISEGRTYCVDVNASAKTYSLWRYSCGGSGSTQVAGTKKAQGTALSFVPTLTLPATAPACPSAHSCLYFYPRGTAIPGTIQIRSSARSKVYTVHVEGLTSRVYL